MSTTTFAQGDTLDVSGTHKVRLSRLVKVELRKMIDTRSGMWLLIAIAVVTVAAVLIFGFAANDQDKTFSNFLGFTGTPQGFLLPVLGILLVTQEWSQRTAMVTFTLEPHRGRILAAKVYAALIIGLAAIALAVVVAALATLVFSSEGNAGFGELGAIDYLKFVLLQGSGVLQGLAFGLLFLASAPAIVTFFVLPPVFSLIANVWGFLADKAAWIDLGTSQRPLFDSGNLTGEQWAQLTVTLTIWVILPFVAGVWRVLRAELK